MKNRFLSLGLAALAATSIGLVSSIPAQNAKLKVAFIYIGPPGDFGWTYAHEQGRIALEKALQMLKRSKLKTCLKVKQDHSSIKSSRTVQKSSSPPASATWTQRSRPPKNTRT